MTEINIPLGKFNIAYKTFRGFAAPDEDVERPVNNDNVEKKLYSRKKAVWQPVQVEIPEGLRFIGYRSFEDCRGLTAVSIPNSITGIGNRAFCSCISLTHVTLPDSALLPFGDIMDIFEKMYVVQNDGRAMDVAVSDIRLGYTRVLKQDEDGVGLLVPAWDFFGTVSYENKLAYAQPDDSLFTINAIDGTVIDRSLGY